MVERGNMANEREVQMEGGGSPHSFITRYLPSFHLSQFLWVSITEETNFPFPALPPSLPISLSSRFPIHLSRTIGREGRTKEEQQTNNQVAKFVQTSDRQTDRQKKRGDLRWEEGETTGGDNLPQTAANTRWEKKSYARQN